VIYAAPGASFEATLTGAPTGLAGTLGVRILDNAGGTTTARATAGIAEFPAGSGFYTVTLTAPTTAGQYSVFWDTDRSGRPRPPPRIWSSARARRRVQSRAPAT
jgi:hypothetical protein